MQSISTTSCDLNETSLTLDIVWLVERMDAIFANWTLLNIMSIINLHRKVDIWKYNILCRIKNIVTQWQGTKNLSLPLWCEFLVDLGGVPNLCLHMLNLSSRSRPTILFWNEEKFQNDWGFLPSCKDPLINLLPTNAIHHCLNHVPYYFSWGNP